MLLCSLSRPCWFGAGSRWNSPPRWYQPAWRCRLRCWRLLQLSIHWLNGLGGCFCCSCSLGSGCHNQSHQRYLYNVATGHTFVPYWRTDHHYKWILLLGILTSLTPLRRSLFWGFIAPLVLFDRPVVSSKCEKLVRDFWKSGHVALRHCQFPQANRFVELNGSGKANKSELVYIRHIILGLIISANSWVLTKASQFQISSGMIFTCAARFHSPFWFIWSTLSGKYSYFPQTKNGGWGFSTYCSFCQYFFVHFTC